MIKSSETEFDDLGLKYRSYLPEIKSNKCLLLVHGRAGNSKVMWIFTKALGDKRCAVIAPQAFMDDSIGGFSWWEIGGNKDKSGDLLISDSYLAEAVSRLEKFIENLKNEHSVNEVIAFGFSQGAGLISALAVKNPNIFSSIAMLSGFLPSPARFELEQNFSSNSLPPIFMFHGLKDETITFDRAKRDCEVLSKYCSNLTFIEDDVAHKVSSLGVKELKKWVEAHYNNHD